MRRTLATSILMFLVVGTLVGRLALFSVEHVVAQTTATEARLVALAE